MKRVEFAKKFFILTSHMVEDGVDYVIDYVLRSQEEQKRLFDKGLSKCDGFKILSAHQKGLAVDIYFVVNGKIDFGFTSQEAKDYSKKYHDIWASMGGQPVIEWDHCHYSLK
jgi:hypothetical protein